jgi:hypothetical protein
MGNPDSSSAVVPDSPDRSRVLPSIIKPMLMLAALILLPLAVQSNWLTRFIGTTERAGNPIAARTDSAGLEKAAAYMKALPDRPDGAILAAQATQEGHWRFVNKAGETFTAGTPDEMKRVASVLLPDAMPDAKLTLYVTQDTLFRNRETLKELPKGTQLSSLVGDECYRILGRLDAGEHLFAEVRPNLLVEISDRARFDEALWQLMRPLDRASVRVLALEPGGPSTLTIAPRMDADSGRAVVDVIDPASLPAALGSIRGQTVLVTGRVEGQLLFVKPSSGPERSLLVRDLLKAAEDADVNLIMLQSSSTPRQPGGRNWFWQKVEVKGLDDALQRARMADFLNALAGTSRRFAISATPSGSVRTSLDLRPAPDLPGDPLIKPVGDLFSGLVSNVTGRVVTSAVQADLRNAGRQHELDHRLVPGVPADMQLVYLGLIVLGLIGLPVSRAWWRRIWPPELPSEYAMLSGYWAAQAVRGAVFLLVFLPLTAMAAGPVNVVAVVWGTLTLPWRRFTGKRISAGTT